MSSINFDNAYLLLIAIPLGALLSGPFFLAVKKNNVNGHNVASLVLHVVMALLIAFTAAGTTLITTVTETNVYVVADVSYSANRNLDAVDQSIKNISMPRNSRMGVVCYGKDYRLLTRLGETFRTVRDSGVDDSATNTVEALEYAGSLFRDGVVKRIVLVTDGKETYNGDANALRRTVDNLKSENIRVDAIFIDDNIKDSVKEVQISSVDYTSNAYLNHSESVSATIQNSFSEQVDAIVTLTLGETMLEEKAAMLSTGINTVNFDKLVTNEAGTYEYKITVRSESDTNMSNNSISFTQTVTEDVNILLVTTKQADYDALVSVYGNADRIYAPLLAGEKVPYSVEALCAYDEIILSDINVSSSVRNYEMFLESAKTAVELFGKSLITFGDTGIQNDIDKKLETLDNMLPVNFGNGNQDEKLYTIVFDISRSMGTLSKFARAKTAAIQLIDYLNEGDVPCALAFYGTLRTLYFEPLSNNLEVARKTIQDMTLADLDQGTMLGNAMAETYKRIRSSNYDKHVMVISDGLTYGNESDDPLEVTKQMVADGITVSVIDIGRGAANDSTANKAKQLLENIAAQGGGDYFYANTEEELKDVIFGDLANEMKETVIERSTTVNLSNRYRRDDTVSGITDFSYINGYYNSKEKASASTVLTVNYFKANGGSVPVPLYAYKTLGNGKVGSFTSSLSGDWIAPWKRESGPYNQFLTNVISVMTPNEKIDVPYITEVRSESGYAAIDITPAAIRTDATATVSVQNPSGEQIQSAMAFDSAIYSFRMLTPAVGNYNVTITYSYAEKDYEYSFVYTVSYLPEYDNFTVFEASGLNRAIGAEGTVSNDGKLELVNDSKEMSEYTVDLTAPILIACVVLFAVDIIVRKLKWSDIKSLFKKVNK